MREAELEGRRRREEESVGSAGGIYVVFESFPDIALAIEKLDPQQGKVHAELISVQEEEVEGELIERATVFIPDGKLGYFLKRLEQYAESSEGDKPRHAQLVDRIRSIGLASLEQLWTDPPSDFPGPNEMTWWEVWLRRKDGLEGGHLKAFAEDIDARVGPRGLGFADRTIFLLQTTATQLARALNVLDDLAELRRPRLPGSIIAMEPAEDQAEWVQDLLERTQSSPENAPAACVIDTGVHQDHPLLSQSLDPGDCHACDPTWGVHDHDGHGTEMAGLALYGDLGTALISGMTIRLRHRLESVKFLPPAGANPPDLYGAVTATAASLAEISAPMRRRVFCMATTARWMSDLTSIPEIQLGQPTSWSAAMDALAAGLSVDIEGEDGEIVFLDEGEDSARRLFLVSAGNVLTFEDDHLTRSDIEPVEDPAQAWNALTVGAFTELDSLEGAGSGFEDWVPLTQRGDLSPHSRTSVAFDRRWPIKPDVVMEGGNVARSPSGSTYDTPEILQVPTTRAPFGTARLLTVTNATSAATAQSAHLAAGILADYPELWPETVRALIVHSAEWTDRMMNHFGTASTRAAKVALHRRYGMGVPDLLRATRSATDALTLVAQDMIYPYDKDGRMREMHLHDLPWPTDILSDLGSAHVQLRVTLSYFVEPNPGRRGWTGRYNYASHGLRFEVRRPHESMDDFRKRVNQKALDEEEKRPKSQSDASSWFFGPDQRTAGSLHTDIWTGTAADLARRGAVAVFPVSGWWKELKSRGRQERGARYALVVSIETPEQDVDIWSPVAAEVGIPIEVET